MVAESAVEALVALEALPAEAAYLTDLLESAVLSTLPRPTVPLEIAAQVASPRRK